MHENSIEYVAFYRFIYIRIQAISMRMNPNLKSIDIYTSFHKTISHRQKKIELVFIRNFQLKSIKNV